MINADEPPEDIERRLDEILARGPHGALALAGVATVIVFAIWLAFYLFVFTPRAAP